MELGLVIVMHLKNYSKLVYYLQDNHIKGNALSDDLLQINEAWIESLIES